MAGSAAERPPSSTAADPDSDWNLLVRLWRRVLVFLAHWRLRVGRTWRLVAGSIRRGVRYALRWSRRPRQPSRARDSLLPTVAEFDVLPVPRERPDADQSSTRRPLPSGRGTRRGLPASRGALQVERTADRLTISDPAADEAFLSSTHWVDVEE